MADIIMSQQTENYLVDLGAEIMIKAQEAQRAANQSADGFEKGRQIALYGVLSLMKQQAEVFGLGDEAIGLEGVDIEQFLV